MLWRIIGLSFEAPVEFGNHLVPAFRVDPTKYGIDLLFHAVAALFRLRRSEMQEDGQSAHLPEQL
jgi:hypothetical protein